MNLWNNSLCLLNYCLRGKSSFHQYNTLHYVFRVGCIGWKWWCCFYYFLFVYWTFYIWVLNIWCISFVMNVLTQRLTTSVMDIFMSLTSKQNMTSHYFEILHIFMLDTEHSYYKLYLLFLHECLKYYVDEVIIISRK